MYLTCVGRPHNSRSNSRPEYKFEPLFKIGRYYYCNLRCVFLVCKAAVKIPERPIHIGYNGACILIIYSSWKMHFGMKKWIHHGVVLERHKIHHHAWFFLPPFSDENQRASASGVKTVLCHFFWLFITMSDNATIQRAAFFPLKMNTFRGVLQKISSLMDPIHQKRHKKCIHANIPVLHVRITSQGYINTTKICMCISMRADTTGTFLYHHHISKVLILVWWSKASSRPFSSHPLSPSWSRDASCDAVQAALKAREWWVPKAKYSAASDHTSFQPGEKDSFDTILLHQVLGLRLERIQRELSSISEW